MKRLSITLIWLIAALFCANLSAAGPGEQNYPQAGDLDSRETSDLLLMREEEKMARDVYIKFDDHWNDKIFRNISRSEQRHMDAMLTMLNYYGLPDPVGDNEIGEFTSQNIATLYGQLLDRGYTSHLEALQTAAYVEEIDIRDLRASISYTDELPLLNSYTNLLAGARNHLRVFVARIRAEGVEYVAQVLSQEDVEGIVGDYTQVPPAGFSINPGLNDAWFYPGTDGQGFVITVFPGKKIVFLVWFTYDTELPDIDAVANLGDPGQRWLTAQGTYFGAEADLEIGFMKGGIFDDEDTVPIRVPGGSILLQFEDCNNGSVFYDIPSIGRTGMVPIQRISDDNVAQCHGAQPGKADD